MSDERETGGERAPSGVGDALRTAIERTLEATAGSAVSTRERAGELVDEVVRRGRETRDEVARRGQKTGAEIARRGQEAGAGLARRGQEASGEVARRLELLERRLAELEATLAGEKARGGKAGEGQAASNPRPESET
jgi:polyhydroxyalkanoate synthesis regulator phasin